MRYSLLLTVVACFVWNLSTAQQRALPAVSTAQSKNRSNATTMPEKQAVASADRTPVVSSEGQKTNTGTSQGKSTAKKTVVTTQPKKTTTIPATTYRNGNQATVRPVKPLSPAVVPSIKWLTIEEALEKSKTEKRKILVDVYTDWCGWCKHMDSTTYLDPVVVNYINEKYYAVKFNAEQVQDIQYKDKVYKFKKTGARGFHELAGLWLNNRLSYPTTVVLNEDQDVIQPIPGYQDASKMDAIIHYFGTDSHKKTPWEKYEKNYSREQK